MELDLTTMAYPYIMRLAMAATKGATCTDVDLLLASGCLDAPTQIPQGCHYQGTYGSCAGRPIVAYTTR